MDANPIEQNHPKNDEKYRSSLFVFHHAKSMILLFYTLLNNFPEVFFNILDMMGHSDATMFMVIFLDEMSRVHRSVIDIDMPNLACVFNYYIDRKLMNQTRCHINVHLKNSGVHDADQKVISLWEQCVKRCWICGKSLKNQTKYPSRWVRQGNSYLPLLCVDHAKQLYPQSIITITQARKDDAIVNRKADVSTLSKVYANDEKKARKIFCAYQSSKGEKRLYESCVNDKKNRKSQRLLNHSIETTTTTTKNKKNKQ